MTTFLSTNKTTLKKKDWKIAFLEKKERKQCQPLKKKKTKLAFKQMPSKKKKVKTFFFAVSVVTTVKKCVK